MEGEKREGRRREKEEGGRRRPTLVPTSLSMLPPSKESSPLPPSKGLEGGRMEGEKREGRRRQKEEGQD
jgi:hypothetical protein